MKKIIALSLGAVVSSPAYAYAATALDSVKGQLSDSYARTDSGGFLSDIGLIINWVLGFVGLVALIYFLYGGFLYLTAGDSSDNAKKGITVITNAVIGIVIIMLAYSLVSYVTGATIFGGGAGGATSVGG